MKTIVKEDIEVYKECISCPNANKCAGELKQGDMLCLTLYAKFTEDNDIRTRLENILKED